jgi:hypothetical protein
MRPLHCLPTLAALVLAAVLGACARDESRALQPPAVISLDDRSCVTEPALTGSQVLALAADKTMTIRFDAATPCLQPRDGAKSTYTVVRLPETDRPYLLGITSLVRGVSVFSPRVMVLDAQGKLLREKRRDDFLFQGLTLYAGLRAYPGDTYLLVASDPSPVGQQDVQLDGSMRQLVISTGVGAAFPINTGAESNRAFTYAHSGTVTVAARPLPPGNEPAMSSEAPPRK